MRHHIVSPERGWLRRGSLRRDEAESLMQECQRQRQLNIAPLKEQAIEDCVNKQRRDCEYCKRHNRNFGERRAGGTLHGMFLGAPGM